MTERIFTSSLLEAEFRKSGYSVIPGFLNQEQIMLAREFFEETIPSAGIDEPFYTSHWSKDLSYRKKTSEFLQKLFYQRSGDFIRGYKSVYAHYLVKKPGTGSEFKMHQDWTLIDERNFVGITIWCALGKVTKDNGCMSVVPGSHLVSGNIRGSNIGTGVGDIPAKYLVKLELNAGDAVAFDHRLFHSSGDNLSSDVRLAAGIVLIPIEARMIHYFRDNASGIISKYEADDKFLEQFSFGDDIGNYKKVGEIPEAATQITNEELIQRLNDYKREYETANI